MSPESQRPYNRFQFYSLLVLQILIGWHLLYEGLIKLMNPAWTSLPYLLESRGLLTSWFRELAAHPTLLNLVDVINIWGLILVGAGLIICLFTRYLTFAGIVLLLLYYLSHPPFIGMEYTFPAEGSYHIVNKTLIEIAALVVLLAFPIQKWTGLDLLRSKIFQKK